MNVSTNIVAVLTRVAEGITPVARARIVAAFIYKNRIVAIGTNQYRTDPLMLKYGHNSNAIYLHAEIAALKNAIRAVGVDNLSRLTLQIVRRKKCQVTHQFIDGMAKPCAGCARALRDFGVTDIRYTT